MDQLLVKILEHKEAHQLFQVLVLQVVDWGMEVVLHLTQQHQLMVDQVGDLALLEIMKVQEINLLLVRHKEILVVEMLVLVLTEVAVVELVEQVVMQLQAEVVMVEL